MIDYYEARPIAGTHRRRSMTARSRILLWIAGILALISLVMGAPAYALSSSCAAINAAWNGGRSLSTATAPEGQATEIYETYDSLVPGERVSWTVTGSSPANTGNYVSYIAGDFAYEGSSQMTGTLSESLSHDVMVAGEAFILNISLNYLDAALGSAQISMTASCSANVAAPVAGDSSATVIANSSNNPIPLDLSGGAASSVAIGAPAAHGTTTVSGTDILYTPAPGYVGSDSFTYTATNSGGASAPATVAITVQAPPLSLSPATGSLPAATTGINYTQAFTPSGGQAPYSFAITAGVLPANLTLGSDGTVSGVPLNPGDANFTITVTDNQGATASAAYILLIGLGAPIASNSSTTVAANGSDTPITLALSGGATDLVAIDTPAAHGTATASGTTISYTPAAGYAGPDSFTYTATNATGTSAPATVTITVSGAPLTLPPAGPFSALQNTMFSQQFTASGGTLPYSYVITSASTGSGLTLSSDGLLSGTLIQPGANIFDIRVTDGQGLQATQRYRIDVNANVILDDGTVGVAYTPKRMTGGIPLRSGNIPQGMALNQTGSRLIFDGTPTTAGTYHFVMANGDEYTITIRSPAPLALTPAAGPLPAGTVGTTYNQGLSADGGTGPYSFSAPAGSLPPGLTLANDGTLGGTPTAEGATSFTVTATDSLGAVGSATYTITVTAALAMPIASDSSATVAADSAANPIALTLSGGAAASIAIDTPAAHGTATASGTSITYTPTPGYAGSDSFTYIATNATGSSAPATVTLTISSATLTVSPAAGSLPGATAGAVYSRVVSATGGTAPYSYTATGLPPGLAIDPATGAIAGTPTTAGSYAITVQVADAHGAVGTATYTLIVAVAAPIAANSAITVAADSSANPVPLALTGGAAASVAVVSPPAHGSAAVSGATIRYTPTAGFSGTDSFTYTATNGSGTSAAATVTITVSPAAVVLSPAGGTLPAATVGVAYDQAISATGSAGPYAFTVASGALPAGLSLSADGRISGSPTAAGDTQVTIRVTDANGASASATYAIAVAPPPPVARDADPLTVAGSSNVQTGSSVDINLSALVAGVVDDIRIVTPPKHGTVTINRTVAMRLSAGPRFAMAALALSQLSVPGQVVAVYTPEPGYRGPDSFQFVAVGPGGSSAPATVAITVQEAAPVARDLTATAIDNQTVSIDLTGGVAAYGPFLAAMIVDMTPSDAVTAVIVATGTSGAQGFRLDVTPRPRFGGEVKIRYTLANAAGVSTPATVTVGVTARPDPSLDPTVRAIGEAQAEATRRFSRAQVDNFMRRAESLHGRDCGVSQMGIRLAAKDPTSARRVIDEDDASRQERFGGQTPSTGSERPAAPTDRASASGTCDAGTIALWSAGAIDIGTRDATTDRSKISATTKGLSFGADVQVAKGTMLGLGVGFGGDSSSIAGGQAHVSADSKVVALYGSATPLPALFVDAILAHGWLDFKTRRGADNDLIAAGSRDGRFTTVALAAGIERSSGALRWSLYGRTEILRGVLKAYEEDGADLYNLRFDRRRLRSTLGALGFRALHLQRLPFGALTAGLRGEWQHEFNSGGQQALDYIDVAGPAFYTIDSRGWAREQFILSPGLELILPSAWQLGLELGVRATRGERAATARVQVKKGF